MYCDAMHIPKACHWGAGEDWWAKHRSQNEGTATEKRHKQKFEFPDESDGTPVKGASEDGKSSADEAQTRVHALTQLVKEIARRMGVTKEFQVDWDTNPFASPAAGIDGNGKDTLWLPSIWLITESEMSPELDPGHREALKDTRPRLKTLKQDLHNAGIRFDQEIPDSLAALLQAQEVLGVKRGLSEMTQYQRAETLFFLLGHELGHIHHGHLYSARSAQIKKKSALFGLMVALLVAALGAAAYPLLRQLPLKDLIASYAAIGAVAIGAGVFAGRQRLHAYDRADELEADQFSLYGASGERDNLAQNGGIYFFETALGSGKAARKYSRWRTLLYNRDGGTRLLVDSEHPPANVRRDLIFKAPKSVDKKGESS